MFSSDIIKVAFKVYDMLMMDTFTVYVFFFFKFSTNKVQCLFLDNDIINYVFLIILDYALSETMIDMIILVAHWYLN